MLPIDICWTGSAVSQYAAQTDGMSSRVAQPTQHTEPVVVTLKSRPKHYFELLSTT